MAAPPIAVVGASLAGLRAAQGIRDGGYDGEIVMVGDEAHAPYTRPPLSKELLAGAQEPAACALDASALEATWRLGARATGLDLASRRLALEGGEQLAFSGLVLATGCRARRWPGDEPDLPGLHVVRTVDDALALRRALAARPRVAIVGAGFVGCEVAATARKLGLEVTVVELAAQPMPALGAEIGRRCAALHREHGVELRLGMGVERFEGDGRLEALRLTDGTRVEADVAVVALGAIPNTEWLAASGLTLQPGVVCDATLRAVGAPRVFCAGDIAAWPHPLADEDLVRIEHWTTAAEQGHAAGRNLVVPAAERRPFTAVPYFWSDQYDVKIQSVGFPARAERVRVVEASSDGRRFVAIGERDGRLVAAVGFNAARRIAWYRRELARRPPAEEVLRAVREDERALGPAPREAAAV